MEHKYYEPEFFNLKKKLVSEEWYEKVKDVEFNFQKEFEDYCLSDVQLLTQGCLKLRAINMQDTSVDPFQVASTIASYCKYIFRSNFMKHESIAIIPELGYNLSSKTRLFASLFSALFSAVLNAVNSDWLSLSHAHSLDSDWLAWQASGLAAFLVLNY